ncbi:MAG: hypothetical protein IKW89_00250 [Bacteroidales bacterium]|nr:hypothetical protein [Bacteroidales bacterium]
MTAKEECLERIRTMMKDKDLKHIFLENYVHCPKWPGRENPYQIVELLLREDGRIEAWQGPGFKYQQANVCLDEFDASSISQVENELINTISKLKTYRVQIVRYVDVDAPTPERAEQLVSCSRFYKQEILLRFETEELQ